MNKQEQAIQIVKENASKSRKEVINLIREKLQMSDAGASTYYYNAQKKIAAAEQVDAVNEQLASETNTQKPINVENNAAAHAKTSATSNERAAQKDQLNDILTSIDLNDIPAFLKKGMFA